jgi:hypothetical protein
MTASKLLVIIVLSSVQLVITTRSRALDDQYQILSSSNMIRESEQRYPDQRPNVISNRGLKNRYQRISSQPVNDYEPEQDSYYGPSAVETSIR